MNIQTQSLAPPKFSSLINETRALRDIASLPIQYLKHLCAKRETPNTKSYPVVLFPGFASDARYMQPLAYYLRSKGYPTLDWGLGRNEAGLNYEHTLEDISDSWELEYPMEYSPENYKGEASVSYLCDRATEKVAEYYEDHQTPLVLVGWSLGGVVARECAREIPEAVAKVITFGSPVVGGPKYSRAADYFKARGLDLEWIERQVTTRNKQPIQRPITAIYSKTDGIVSWQSAIDDFSPNVKHVEIDCAHLGMAFNSKVWRVVLGDLDALSKIENSDIRV